MKADFVIAGGPGHAVLASNSAAVFVIGGSGITYALAGINELIHKDLKGESRVKLIEMIWIVQDPGGYLDPTSPYARCLTAFTAALVPMLPSFFAMIQQSVYTPIRISVFYTRAVVGKFPFPKDSFHPGLSLSPGRPKVGSMLEDAITRALAGGRGDGSGMVVAVCGPTSLADDVAKQVSRIDPQRRDEIGGIEIHEEYVAADLLLMTYSSSFSVFGW